MSVYEQAYATPSRVLGAYRFLLRSKGQRVGRRELEEMLMPEHLPLKDAPPDDEESEGDKKDTPKREMARRSIDEGLAMRLLAEDGDDVLLHPDLSPQARSADVAERIAPRTMGSLIMSATHTANHDLARAIAWYLGQDAYAAPTSWQDVDQKYLSDAKKLEMTNSRFGQLLHWSRFLGFAWAHAVPEKSGQKGSKLGLTPDPYRQILWSLEEVFIGRESEVLPLAGVVTALSTMVPVLEGGSFRSDLETSLLPAREPHQLSSTTAHAWLRLHEEGIVRLDYRSDGTAYVFPDGDGEKTYTEVSWQRPSTDVMQ